MVEFSISAILDGLIHLGAFLLVCMGLYMFLKLVARDKFETNFFRTIVVVAAFVVGKVYLTNNTEWAQNIVVQIAVLGGVVLLLTLQFLKTGPLVGLLASMLLVAMGIGAERGAVAFSAKVAPEGPTFAEYMGVAQQAIEKNKALEDLKPTDVDVVDVVRKGLDALATLTAEDEMDAMTSDFNHGMSLFAERKAWTDSLTPEEKLAYREEMAAFLAEQGIAEDRYSLAAMKDVNPTNLVALADLFSELGDENVAEEERVRSISESIAQITANLGGFNLTDENKAMLREFAEMVGKDDMKQAVEKARQDLEAVKGDDEFLATALAAMMQTRSDLPMDQMLGESEGEGFMSLDSLKAMASNHWKKEGKDPAAEWMSFGPPVVVEIVEVVEVVDDAAAPSAVERKYVPPPPDPFIKITTHLGVVLVPNDDAEMHEWIAAAQSLEIKGYVSLGNEVVILRPDGVMMRKGEIWELARSGYTYHFAIDRIMKNRVSLKADGRAPTATIQ